ncbi:hypothetical protein [Burkholderia sp. WSM2230]|uniref:hypothetical protein n=1 Tax=Burkholderia sp. WSM2230 TaxID=944435 RepID=UPI00041F1599|nr:hypothetical protein [Burkholderia sp. WSM2230]
MNQNIALNIEASHTAADIGTDDLHDEAYNEGAFYAETDWQHCRKRPGFLWGPESMAEHCAVVWADIVTNICPEWNTDHARLSFLIGYEDRATELADAGEAGYEALAEAGTVADTDGWILQCEPWTANASDSEKGLRAIRAAWAGAAAWQARADSTAAEGDRHRAEEALIRAEAAGDYMLDGQYVSGHVTRAH